MPNSLKPGWLVANVVARHDAVAVLTRKSSVAVFWFESRTYAMPVWSTAIEKGSSDGLLTGQRRGPMLLNSAVGG